MTPAAYWISGAVVCGVMAAVLIGTHGTDDPPAPSATVETGAAAPSPETDDIPAADDATAAKEGKTVKKLVRSEEEWKQLLTPAQYHILREKGTERPWSGALLKNKEAGVYKCAGCGLPLFRSDGKFDSGCGWPSFFEPLEGAHISEHVDTSHGMVRTEITCSRCGGHLGHVFTDGPPPTGLRYCVNSVSIEFEKGAAADDAETAKNAADDDAAKGDR